MRNKGEEGKRERLSSKGNKFTKPGLDGGFAEKPASCQRGRLQAGALGGQGAIYPNRQQSREERKKAAGDKDQTSQSSALI